MSGNRELSIKITVNAGQSKQVVDALAQALGRLGTATPGAASKGATAATAAGGAAKSATGSIDTLIARLRELANKGSPEAKRALNNLQSSYHQFGKNSKEAAAALTAATQAIKTFNATAATVGRGNTNLLGSSVQKTKNDLAALSQQINKTYNDAKASIGRGNLVQPLQQQLTAQMQATKRALDDLKAAQAQYLALQKDKAAGVQTVSTKQVRDAKLEVDRLTGALKAEHAALANLGVSLTTTANGERAMALATQQANAASQKAAQAAKAQAAAQAALKRSVADASASIQQQIDTNRRNAYSLTIMGYQARAAGQMMLDSFKGAVDTFTEFDFTARRAAVTMGLLEQGSSKTAMGLGDFEKEFQQVAITTKLFNPEEIAKGFYYWGSTTGAVVDSMESLKAVSAQVVPIMKAAAMTGTDLETSLKGVYAITEQFNLGIDASASVMDRLFYVSQKTALELPDLLNSFKMVGPVAAQANVSFEDMTTLLGAIGDAGIRGSMAGRAFRQFFIRLAKDSELTTGKLDAAVAALGGLEKTWDEAIFPAGKFIGMQETLNKFSEITKNMTLAQRNQLLASASTANELPVLTQLVDANTKSLAENNIGIIDSYNAHKNLAESAGSVEAQWKVMGESAKAVFGELSNKIAPVVLRVGKSLVEAFKPLAKTIGDIAVAVAAWADANPAMFDMIVKVAALSAGLLTLMGSLLLVTGAIKLLTGTVLKEFAFGLVTQDVQIAKNTASLNVYSAALARVKAMSLLGGKSSFIGPVLPTSNMSKVKGGLGSLAGMGSSLLGTLKTVTILGSKLLAIGAIVGFVVGAFMGLIRGLGGVGAAAGAVTGTISKLAGGIGEVVHVVTGFMGILLKGAEAVGFFAGRLLSMVGSIPLVGEGFEMLTGAIGGFVNFLGEALHNVGIFFDAVIQGANDAMDNLDPAGKQARMSAQMAAMQDADKAEAVANATSRAAALLEQQDAYNTAMLEETARGMAAASAEVAAHQEVMRQAAELGIYLPMQMTFSKTAKMAEENGKLVAQSFSAGIFTDETQLFEAGKFIVDNAIKGMKSKDEDVAMASREALLTFTKAWYTEGAQNISPAALAVMGFAEQAIQSKSADMRSLGAGMMEFMGSGIIDGGAETTPIAMGYILEQIRAMVYSNNPAMQQQGMDMMAWMAQGLLADPNVSANSAAVINGVLQTLSAGAPGAAVAGYNMTASWFKGQYQSFNASAPGLVAAISALKKQLYDITKLGTSADPKLVESIRAQLTALDKLSKVTTNLKAPALKPYVPSASAFKAPAAPKLSTGGGGGGGKGGTVKNPLTDALTVAQNTYELAVALNKIDGMNVKAMVQKSMKGVAEAMKLAINITASVAKGVSGKKMQSVADFSAAGGAVAQAIGDVAEAFSKMETFKHIPVKTVKQIVADMKGLVSLIAKTAKGFKGSTLGAAQVFAEAASTIVQSVATAFEAFSKIGAYKRVSSTVFRDLSLDMVVAVKYMIAASKTVKQTLVAAAAEFGTSAADIVGSIGQSFDVFLRLKDYVRPLPGVLQSIVSTTVEAVALMIVAMGQFHLSAEQTTALAAFSEAVTSVVDAIGHTYDAFVKTIQFVDQFREVIDFNTVFGWIQMAMTRMSALASTYAPEVIEKTKALADAAASIGSAIEAFFNLGRNASQDPDALGAQVQAALDSIVNTMASFVGAFTAIGATIMVNLASGMASQEVLLQAQIDRVQNMLGGLSTNLTLNVTGDNAQLTITHVIRDPDGALRNADSAQVAEILSGSTFISNLQHSAQTQ